MVQVDIMTPMFLEFIIHMGFMVIGMAIGICVLSPYMVIIGEKTDYY